MIRNIAVTDGNYQAADLPDDRCLAFDSLLQNPVLPQVLAGVYVGDANEALFFLVSQLAYTEATVYERQYTPMQYEQLVPISNEAGDWVDSIRFETEDIVGRGKRTSGKGRDLNLVDSSMGDVIVPVVMGDVAYDYTTEELRRTAQLRRPISDRRLNAAMIAYRRHMNVVALHGEQELPGLFNNPVVPSGNAVNGAWLTTNSANPALIRQDINEMIYSVWTNTNFNEIVNTIAIEPARFNYISTTPFNAYSEKTILDYVKQSNIAKTQQNVDITFVPAFNDGQTIGLTGTGPGGTSGMMAYVKDQDHVVMHIPLPLRFLAPQLRGLAVEVPGEYKYSGVEFKRQKSAVYRWGI